MNTFSGDEGRQPTGPQLAGIDPSLLLRRRLKLEFLIGLIRFLA